MRFPGRMWCAPVRPGYFGGAAHRSRAMTQARWKRNMAACLTNPAMLMLGGWWLWTRGREGAQAKERKPHARAPHRFRAVLLFPLTE